MCACFYTIAINFLWTPAQRKRATMLYFANVFYLFFLWPPNSPALVNGGSRKFYTWWTLSVIREVSSWIFFLITLKLQGGRKSDEIRRICRPHPQTFCSHARNTAEYCNSEKKLVKHRWLLYSNATFGELWPTNP